jgi:hypothetical protein
MTNIRTFVTTNLLILIVLAAAFTLRFINLGYSDYQGDEIKAFFLVNDDEETEVEFLLEQRKGPLQFLVTGAIGLLDPAYENQLLTRFPFALAGFLAVWVFYLFVRAHFGEKTAFYAALFFATNGFILGLSRIVQYQPFVFLFMLLALYLLTRAVKEPAFRIPGLYWSLVAWAVSILSHYDGILIAPFMAYLLWEWFRQPGADRRRSVKHFLIAGTLAGGMLAVFYIPYVFSISQATLNYWNVRINETASTKLASSLLLFRIYQPVYALYIYLLLGGIGALAGLLLILPKRWREDPRLATLTKEIAWEGGPLKMAALGLWVLVSLAFMEALVFNPGTHIYTYLVPAFIFLGLGIQLVEGLVVRLLGGRLGRLANLAGLAVMFAFLYAQSYAIFVDHRAEYPWENERFLIWTLNRPTTSLHEQYHLMMFGFPYYRGWEDIRAFVESGPAVSGYSTNERRTIARYYMRFLEYSEEARYYVSVSNPQSFFEVLNKRMEVMMEQYAPVFTTTEGGRVTAKVYLVTKEMIAELTRQGY